MSVVACCYLLNAFVISLLSYSDWKHCVLRGLIDQLITCCCRHQKNLVMCMRKMCQCYLRLVDLMHC